MSLRRHADRGGGAVRGLDAAHVPTLLGRVGVARRLAASKRLLNQSFAVSMAEAIEGENTAQALMASTRDTAEAILAFFERREPRFAGS